MSELNIADVKLNIIAIMDNRGLKQKDIVEITGMPQANVSRALDTENKKMFTVDQLYKLAEAFEVSIDELLGRRRKYTRYQDPTQREICAFLVDLFERGYFSHFKHLITEKVYEVKEEYDQELGFSCPVCEDSDKAIEYTCMYLDNYWHFNPDLYEDQESLIEAQDQLNQCGNDLSNHMKINEFLNKYIKIFTMYKDGELPEDAYRYTVNGYLNEFK